MGAGEADRSASRRYRHAWVIGVTIRALLRGGDGTQRTRPETAIGAAVAMQVVLRELSPRQWPFVLAAPLVLAHHEELQLRHLRDVVLLASEPVIEPAHVDVEMLEPGVSHVSMPNERVLGRGLGLAMRRRRNDGELIVATTNTVRVL